MFAAEPAGHRDPVSPRVARAEATAELLRRHIEGTAYDINVRMRSAGVAGTSGS
ncbi:hypothetical protein SGLAM104S_04018 [Streptomyces glaucescens]